MRLRSTAAAASACTALATGACGGGVREDAPSAPVNGTNERGTTSTDSNQRLLTRAESLELVAWATAFRACMLDRGSSVGPVTRSRTQLAMELPPGTAAGDVVPVTTACAEAQGGPPEDASLQYRPGELVLYLPEQCLLDERVAAS